MLADEKQHVARKPKKKPGTVVSTATRRAFSAGSSFPLHADAIAQARVCGHVGALVRYGRAAELCAARGLGVCTRPTTVSGAACGSTSLTLPAEERLRVWTPLRYRVASSDAYFDEST